MRPAGVPPDASAQVIPNVPVRRWGDNTCGSAALATVLNHLGDSVTEEQLNERFAKGRNGGVVSVDLLLEARRRGFAATLQPGTADDVVSSLERGTPVILMVQIVNLPGETRDLYHYVVIDGLDAKSNLVRMQFGDGKARWAPLASLEAAWSGAGNAMLVVDRRRPGDDAAPDASALLRRAIALEDNGEVAAALAIYRQLLAGTASPSLVWTNIGNAEAKLGDTREAERAYRSAIAIDPGARDAMNNLAWMLLGSGSRLEEAEQLARRATAITGPDSWNVDETLAAVLAAKGNCIEAAPLFAQASQDAPDDVTRARLAAESKSACR